MSKTATKIPSLFSKLFPSLSAFLTKIVSETKNSLGGVIAWFGATTGNIFKLITNAFTMSAKIAITSIQGFFGTMLMGVGAAIAGWQAGNQIYRSSVEPYLDTTYKSNAQTEGTKTNKTIKWMYGVNNDPNAAKAKEIREAKAKEIREEKEKNANKPVVQKEPYDFDKLTRERDNFLQVQQLRVTIGWKKFYERQLEGIDNMLKQLDYYKNMYMDLFDATTGMSKTLYTGYTAGGAVALTGQDLMGGGKGISEDTKEMLKALYSINKSIKEQEQKREKTQNTVTSYNNELGLE
jgi:hypothetical protein